MGRVRSTYVEQVRLGRDSCSRYLGSLGLMGGAFIVVGTLALMGAVLYSTIFLGRPFELPRDFSDMPPAMERLALARVMVLAYLLRGLFLWLPRPLGLALLLALARGLLAGLTAIARVPPELKALAPVAAD